MLAAMDDTDGKVDFGLADVDPSGPSPLTEREPPLPDEPEPEWWENCWTNQPVDLGWLMAQARHLKIR